MCCGVMCCGVIHSVRVFGCCCPCLESAEDHQFRLADLSLSSVPIRWFRKIKHHKIGTSVSLFDGICSCGGDTTEPDPSNKISPPKVPYVPINATLDVIDTRYGPALRIRSSEFVFADDDAVDNLLDSSGVKGSVSEKVMMMKTIPLQEIDSASAGSPKEWADMGLDYAKAHGVILKSKPGESGTRMLVLEIRPESLNDVSKNRTDDIISNINYMITWNKKRLEKKVFFSDEGNENTKKEGDEVAATAGAKPSASNKAKDTDTDYVLMEEKDAIETKVVDSENTEHDVVVVFDTEPAASKKGTVASIGKDIATAVATAIKSPEPKQVVTTERSEWEIV